MKRFGLWTFLSVVLSGCSTYTIAPPFPEPLTVSEQKPSSTRTIDFTLSIGDESRLGDKAPKVKAFLDQKFCEGLEQSGWTHKNESSMKLEVSIEQYAMAISTTHCTSVMRFKAKFAKEKNHEDAIVDVSTTWPLCFLFGYEPNSRKTFNKAFGALSTRLQAFANSVASSSAVLK